MVQELLRQVPSSAPAQEVLLHYYISAKSWPLVLLLGRPGVGKRRLFQLLARGIAGCLDGRIHLLPAQSAWQERVGNLAGAESRPSLEAIQGRFNTMAFLDLLAEATQPGNEGQTYFLALDQATPAELVAYMDLYLIGQGTSGAPAPLPPNLYLTAIVSLPGGSWQLPAALLDRVGIVEVSVPLPEEVLAPAPCPPVGWQRLFLRSAVRDPEQARRRLRGFGRLAELEHLLEEVLPNLGPALEPALEEGVLLYTANSFTVDGQGLLDRLGRANVRQAVDMQLAQRLLPCIARRRAWSEAEWHRLLERCEGTFPRAHARVRRIVLEQSAIAGPQRFDEEAAPSGPAERGGP